MAIKQVTTLSPGLVGVYPRLIYISTNDTLATVTATGYLNAYAKMNPGELVDGDMALVVTATTPSAADVDSGFLQVQVSGGNYSLIQTNSPGSVTLPTIANHIATFTNTTGGISEDPATAISGGNIQAGLSGTAGYLASFPSTAARGSLRLQATANTGNTLTTITNAAMGQASTITIPDPGVASATFVLSDGGTQHITTGNFEVDQGNLIAGSSGHAGTLISYPATAANGTLIIAAVNAGGAFNTTISNGTMGQSTVVSIPDPGASTANFILSKNGTTQTISTGNLALSAGTFSASGNITSSGGILTSGAAAGGVIGKVVLFPTTAARGSLTWQAVANSGDTATIFQTAALGQATTYTVPDPATATANVAVAPAALANGKLVMASGTAGLIADSTIVATNVQLKSQVVAQQSGNIGGAGAGPVDITVTGATAASVAVASLVSSSNAVQIQTVAPGSGKISVTFSGDPGASAIVSYVVYIAAQ